MSSTLDQAHWQERLSALADKHGVVGATLAIDLDGATAEAVHGVLNLRTQQPVTADSLFQAGSITKVWTATLAMQLVDEGLLDLDAPLVTYLPDFRCADPDVSRTVTTRQLLNHTSGIDGDLFLDTGRGEDCLERYVAAMAQLTQVHPQGLLMSYCNSGYSLLGHLVATLRGASWDAVLRERLLTPLGLTSAGTLPEEALLHGAAAGHVVVPGTQEVTVTPQWGIYRSAGPAGLLHSTARDQLAFARLHLAGGVLPDGTRLLSEESVRAMQAEEIDVRDPYTLGTHWGLGWFLMDWSGKRVFGHDGATLGQGAFLRILPTGPGTGLVVSLMVNGGRAARELFVDLFDEIYGSLAGAHVVRTPEPVADVEVDTDALLGGRFVREGMVLEFARGEEGLRLTVTATGPLAAGQEPQVMEVLAHAPDVLLARPAGTDAAFQTFVVFGVDGDTYLHSGARAFRKVA